MRCSDRFIECRAALRLRAENVSLRKLAVELGYPPCKAAMLSHVINGHPQHVSLRVLDDLRARLGLPSFEKPRKQISVSTFTFAAANRARRGAGMTWDAWIMQGVYDEDSRD